MEADGTRSRPARVWQLGALFLVCGPPLGALLPALFIATMIGPGDPPRTPGEQFEAQANTLGVILLLSYPFGGIPALLTGLGAGILARRRDRVPLWQVLLVAALAVLVSGLLWLWIRVDFSMSPDLDTASSWHGLPSVLTILTLAALPATVSCWAIARHRRLL